MTTRREAIALLGGLSAGALLAGSRTAAGQSSAEPQLAPGAPNSPERLALIESFKTRSEGIPEKFEARVHKSDWEMPYRLFRPAAVGKLPLVVYLHGSGGLGTDNQKQMGLGNIFGTRVWAMPENQKRFPRYVVAPQTDRGWIHFGPPAPGDSIAQIIPGLGEGAKLALEIIAALSHQFPIDQQRIYVTGQSMGGSGVWHLTAQRPRMFAAAVPCCGSVTIEKTLDSRDTPLWNFHGSSDGSVPVALSRDRISALRKAGAQPLYTEYAGVDHNSWEWAYTEPELVKWVFSHRRRA